MPYTFAHPVTAIALHKIMRGRLNKTGLAVGSMAPDMQSFAALQPVHTQLGHSTAGMLLFGLPLSVLICFVFQRMIARQVVLHLPTPLAERLYPSVCVKWRIEGWKGWLMLLSSIIAGMYSHLILDGFTHQGGFLFPLTSLLAGWFVSGEAEQVMLLQVLATLGGLVFMLAAGLSAYRLVSSKKSQSLPARFERSETEKWLFWMNAALFSAGATFFSFALYDDTAQTIGSLGIIAVAPFTGLLTGLMAASWASKSVMRAKRPTFWFKSD